MFFQDQVQYVEICLFVVFFHPFFTLMQGRNLSCWKDILPIQDCTIALKSTLKYWIVWGSAIKEWQKKQLKQIIYYLWYWTPNINQKRSFIMVETNALIRYAYLCNIELSDYELALKYHLKAHQYLRTKQRMIHLTWFAKCYFKYIQIVWRSWTNTILSKHFTEKTFRILKL